MKISRPKCASGQIKTKQSETGSKVWQCLKTHVNGNGF